MRQTCSANTLLPRQPHNSCIQQVYSRSYLGSAYWIAGYLVKDVCHFDALRLEYENEAISEEKADEVKMMEYTFRRLTGPSSAIQQNAVSSIRLRQQIKTEKKREVL